MSEQGLTEQAVQSTPQKEEPTVPEPNRGGNSWRHVLKNARTAAGRLVAAGLISVGLIGPSTPTAENPAPPPGISTSINNSNEVPSGEAGVNPLNEVQLGTSGANAHSSEAPVSISNEGTNATASDQDKNLTSEPPAPEPGHPGPIPENQAGTVQVPLTQAK